VRALAAALSFAAMLITGPASAESLIATLSDADVQITSNFTGEQIVVFGAVRGAPEGDPGYEVAVVVQGPDQDVVVRRKERVLGIWANRAAREFTGVPSFYVMHLSRNFASALDPDQFGPYRLGVRSLPFVQSAAAEGTSRQFADAVIGLRTKHRLFEERVGEVEFLAPGVFRTNFFLPSEIPTGQYKVSVFLFRQGSFLAGQTELLTVVKGGYSEWIAGIADQRPLLYGLIAAALAVFTGWLAGVIFRRP
jgi:uncharacterized protein (TIGR02186 family)